MCGYFFDTSRMTSTRTISRPTPSKIQAHGPLGRREHHERYDTDDSHNDGNRHELVAGFLAHAGNGSLRERGSPIFKALPEVGVARRQLAPRESQRDAYVRALESPVR